MKSQGITPEYKCLQDIQAIVKTRVRPDAGVKVSCFEMADKPGGTYRGYIEFSTGWEDNAPRYRNDPGIPLDALIPEKVVAIAQWVVRQAYKLYPEWFI